METVANDHRTVGRERFGHWRELVRQGFAPMDITTDRPDHFHAEPRVVRLGRFQVWGSECSGSEASRTPLLIRQSDPETLSLLITLNGTLLAESAGRNVSCGVGDLHIVDSSYPMRVAFREHHDGSAYRGVSAIVPRAELPLARRLDRVVGLRVPRGDGVGALMTTFLTDLVRRADDLRPTDSPGLGAVVRDLAGTLVARLTDSGDPARVRRGALGLQAKEFILRHLGDPDPAPATVAAAHHISVSYLHEVFREQDTTVARWIRRQRLESARRDLADPAQGACTIQEIARRWGFRHQAHFTRAFRAAYGLAPREHRREALAQPAGHVNGGVGSRASS